MITTYITVIFKQMLLNNRKGWRYNCAQAQYHQGMKQDSMSSQILIPDGGTHMLSVVFGFTSPLP